MVSAPLVAADERRAELLEAAVRALRRLGFERMRLRDVAEEAGVSIGLLQHYFETREQLGREAFAAACGERAHRFAESAEPGGSAWDRIRQMLSFAFDHVGLRDRAATWLDLCAAASRDPRLQREALRVQDVWRAPLVAAIAEGVASGELNPRIDGQAAVDMLLALVDGMELAATIGDPSLSAKTMLAATLDVAEYMLGVQSRTAPAA
ncbi:MAG TPA: TetR family transcriptional regulator C-terminal domain-containing protein [Gaiellaceae bacterium]|nr:TetR family transcriptional regulator C-terminal domain-containing protein [Gaiellaceae bacterium]